MLSSFAVAEAQVSPSGRVFDPAMNKLAKVKWISNYDRGFGSDNEFYKLSKEFLNTRDSTEFRRMANHYNPIVRAMGLLCLAQKDWDHSFDLLLSHWQDSERVFLHQGCFVTGLTVGEFVQRLFANPHFLDPPKLKE
jgi:hypothetical protein